MLFDSHNDAARVRAKLTDFGIAVMMEAPLAADGSFVGTAAYVSPEQAKGQPLGPPSDIYSLGLVLLECLTGVVSYPGEPLPSALARLLRAPDIPPGLDRQWIRLLTAMTATEPTARPSAREVAITLDGITSSRTRERTRARSLTRWWPTSSVCSFMPVSRRTPGAATTRAPCPSWTPSRAP